MANQALREKAMDEYMDSPEYLGDTGGPWASFSRGWDAVIALIKKHEREWNDDPREFGAGNGPTGAYFLRLLLNELDES